MNTKPKELTVGSLFSGIGGLDLGLERAGMRVVWQCEIDPYCRAVLRHHWPGLRLYEDIHDIDGSAEPVDLICGGFPCQPVSVAGQRLEDEDPRWLWPQMARVIGLLRPRFVLVENVPGLRGRGLGLVTGDLASLGYDAEWNVVSAAALGAPHIRKRLFVIAYPRYVQLRVERGWGERTGGQDSLLAQSDGTERDAGDVADPHGFRCHRGARYLTQENWRQKSENGSGWAVEPTVGRVAHGVPNRLAQLRALGNAVVPQVAEAVGRMILAT